MQAQVFLLLFFAILVLLIVIIGSIKGRKKGLKWILWLIIFGVMGYLLLSAEVLRIP